MNGPDKEVLEFIKHFYGKDPNFAKNLFSYGQCFWFAHILRDRFYLSKGKTALYYNQVLNHFACRIGNYLYDINGAMQLCSSGWMPWDEYTKIEPDDSRRVYRDCIYQLSPEEWEMNYLSSKDYLWLYIH